MFFGAVLATGMRLEAAVYNVGTLADLTSRIGSANAGDQIILANGVYTNTGVISVTRSGTATQPILIAAQSVGGAQIGGKSGFQLNGGNYVIIRGFRFTHTNDDLQVSQSSIHCRITQNIFDLNPVSQDWLNVEGDDTEVDHNLFRNNASGRYLGLTPPGGGANLDVPQRLWAHHNHFYNNIFPGSNGGESTRLGFAPYDMSSAWAVVENNVYDQANGDAEAISVKSSDSAIRYNTLTNSRGNINLRAANRMRVEGNFIFNSGSSASAAIRLFGADHWVINNYLQGVTNGIVLGYGTFSELCYNQVAYNTVNNGETAVTKRARVEFNTLVNCQSYLDENANLPLVYAPADCIVANNILQGGSGSFVSPVLAANQVNFTWQSNIFWGGASYAGSPAGGYLAINPQLPTNTAAPFHIAFNSPAIGASYAATSEVVFDMDGQLRPGVPAIGADEYSTAPVAHYPMGTNEVGPFVAATNFDIVAMPWSQTVMPGSSTRFTNLLSAFNGFTDTVTLSVTNLPDGVSAGFSPGSIASGYGVSTLSVTASNTAAPGRYTLLITGASASFTNTTSACLTIGNLPANWADADINNPGIPGSADCYMAVFAVKGGGATISGTSDQFNYVYQPWADSLTLTARIASQPNTSNSARSGVMIRESTNANSRYVDIVALPYSINMEARSSTGGSAATVATFTAANSTVGTNTPVWVKLVRSGSTFTGYASADGATWVRMGATSVTMASTLAGLAVCSYDNAQLNTSTFDNVSVLPGDPPVITNQPASQVVALGANVTFSAGAAAAAMPLSYQWWFNATNNPAWATNATLTLTNAQSTNEGSYFAVVSNAYGAVTSSVASLMINVVASTNLFLDARWMDGLRTNTSLPADSAWYASKASSLTAVTNSLIGLPDPPGGSTLNWWTYFTTNAAGAVRLNVYDTLRVTLAFTPYGVNAGNSSGGLRLGLYNSTNSTRTVRDGVSPNGTNVMGCMLGMNFGQVFGGSMQFYQRTNVPGANLMVSTTSDYTSLGSGGTATGDAGFSNGIPYVLQLLIHRNASSFDLTATIAGTNGWGKSLAAPWTDTNYLTCAYDTFGVRAFTNGLTCTNFTFTQFKVELVATNNHPPVPGSYATNTIQNQPLSIPVANLLAIASDPDGDAVVFTAVSALSASNGSVTLSGGNILYQPPTNYFGADQIPYTLTDYRGAGSTGLVAVTVAPPPQFTNYSMGAGGGFTLSGTGPTDAVYRIFAATNLALPFTNWTPVTTGSFSGGVFNYTDPQASNSLFQFYRVVVP